MSDPTPTTLYPPCGSVIKETVTFDGELYVITELRIYRMVSTYEGKLFIPVGFAS